MVVENYLHCVFLSLIEVLRGSIVTLYVSQWSVLELFLDSVVVGRPRACLLVHFLRFQAGFALLTWYRSQAAPQRRCSLLVLADRGMFLFDREGTLALLCPELDPRRAFVCLLAARVQHLQLLLLGQHVHGEISEPVLSVCQDATFSGGKVLKRAAS